MSALIEQLRKNGLDPATFERLKQVAIDHQAWATQGNSALANYYWGALADYEDGRFSDPAKQIKALSLEDANQVMRQLFATPGYLRIERPMLSYNDLYGVIALVAAVLLGGGWIWRKRRQKAITASAH
ncbi:hypothetical protein GUY40_18660 [Pseudomonas sp. R5(2019)]|nr:hypothetical protein [Pseudomonas sp. R5(2019)]